MKKDINTLYITGDSPDSTIEYISKSCDLDSKEITALENCISESENMDLKHIIQLLNKSNENMLVRKIQSIIANNNNSKYRGAIEEIRESIHEIASRHSLSFSEGGILISDSSIHMNLSLYSESSDIAFAAFYKEHASSIGLSDDLLGKSFVSKKTGKELKIIGLDPDGGERCVRLIDNNGEHYYMLPSEVNIYFS